MKSKDGTGLNKKYENDCKENFKKWIKADPHWKRLINEKIKNKVQHPVEHGCAVLTARKAYDIIHHRRLTHRANKRVTVDYATEQEKIK